MMTLRKRRIILAICVLFFFLAMPAVLLYTSGYRIDSSLHLYKTGGLYIASPLAGSKIFVNNKEVKETNILQSGIFLQSLKPGKYSVIIAKDGYWPWAKKLLVKTQLVTEARAMLIPENPEGKIILRENYTPLEFTKYSEILAGLNSLVKNKEKLYARLSSNGKEKLWWDPKVNKLWVEWLGDINSLPYYFCDDSGCKDKMVILNSVSLIRNADFFPKRRDMVIVAVQNGVFALEIDGRGGRLVQPIYKGKEPFFITYKNENSVYILEDDNLMEIKLD